MTRALRRLQPVITRRGTPPTLVDRYTGTKSVAALVWHPPAVQVPLRIALIDTTEAPGITVPMDEVGWWHPLWIRDEPTASVREFRSPAVPIAPGDAMTLASGARLALTGGQLGLLVTACAKSDETSPPSHGIETYHGYQRHTSLPAPEGLAISRWKLTGSIRLDLHHDGAAVVLALAGDPVLTASREVLPLPRGAPVLVDLSEAMTVHPGALAYLLVIEAVE